MPLLPFLLLEIVPLPLATAAAAIIPFVQTLVGIFAFLCQPKVDKAQFAMAIANDVSWGQVVVVQDRIMQRL